MGRSALLFLLIGLAVGLWLGFNPAAHRAVVQWWNREAATRSAANPANPLGIRQLNSRVARSLRSSPKPLVQPSAQTNKIPTLTQIGDELHTFWLALERVWLNFWAQLHLSASPQSR